MFRDEERKEEPAGRISRSGAMRRRSVRAYARAHSLRRGAWRGTVEAWKAAAFPHEARPCAAPPAPAIFVRSRR